MLRERAQVSITGWSESPAPQPPLVGFVRALDSALDKVTTAEPTFLGVAEKAEVLRRLHRAEQRLAGLRLKVMADADDLALEVGARDVATWLAAQTRTEVGTSSADLRLGHALDRRWQQVGVALRDGRVNGDQARVITRALEELPRDLDPGLVDRAEEHLVGLAPDHRPRELAVLGRRILEVIAPALVEAQEGRRLEDEERRARETTSLVARRLGDGSTRISLKLPDAVADRLATYLDAFTSPRHDFGATVGNATPGALGRAGCGDGDRIPIHRLRGQAFAALLEALDPVKLPEHGGDATTAIVTMSLDDLRSDLAAVGVISSDEGSISAGEARRLACRASIVPAVLGGDGQVLDLGRGARLFTKAQRKALRCATDTVVPSTARCQPGGATPTTDNRGRPADPPTWRTACCCATGTTTAPTTSAICTSDYPMGISGSRAVREPSRCTQVRSRPVRSWCRFGARLLNLTASGVRPRSDPELWSPFGGDRTHLP